jgi:hypothetical protein
MRRDPGIATTAIAVWIYTICIATALAVIGALIQALFWSFGFLPIFVALARETFPVAARYGLAVGVSVGAVFGLTVVLADRHGCQKWAARTMAPIGAIGAVTMIPVTLGFVWIRFLAPTAIVFAWVGARYIARRYLRAEAPRMRQLVH